jgi:hypothetical protein
MLEICRLKNQRWKKKKTRKIARREHSQANHERVY